MIESHRNKLIGAVFGLVGTLLIMVTIKSVTGNDVRILREKHHDLLLIEYRGVRYDAVPREEVLDQEDVMRRSWGNIETRDFDIEYLVNQRAFHQEKIEECTRIVKSNQWYIDKIDEKLMAYKKLFAKDPPKETAKGSE